MKTISVVSNWHSERCGIQGFGTDLADALHYAGFEVWRDPWDLRCPPEYAIYNWHHLTAPDIPPPPEPCTVIAHEVPLYPDVTWPDWFRRPQTLVLVGEPFEDYPVLRYPMLDYVSPCEPATRPFRLGTTGLRGDGVDLLRRTAEKEGWEFSASPEDRFASRQEEIDRLARCHVVALWYWATGRAQSLALPVALAARRPLVLSKSTMLSQAPGWQDYWTDDLDRIAQCVRDALDLPSPDDFYTWSEAVAVIRRMWRQRGLEL